MPRQKLSQKIEPSQYVAIAQADDISLAEDCQKLLKDNDIASKIEQTKKNVFKIKVRQGRFNEAYILIQSRLSPDGFFDIFKEQHQQRSDPNQDA
jgi:hypothetical protein